MFRPMLAAAGLFVALIVPAAAATHPAAGTHTLIVAVAKNLPPAAERKLAVLVLISRNEGAPAGALATPRKPLVVRQQESGLYRVKAEIDSSCTGSCAGSYRISGATNHKLEIIPSCRLRGSGFVCTRVRIVKVY